ncbi:hypothetical protein [Maritimibacter sp. DP1N21-5]|uniref:hypothetical protein n=1 Tax=Maritimibacter sp. DP1N21-5 TaxID=2836867 RepID=UPI001C4583DA|nr:hypothetical protein [Maritimibacter sp. DP1N21-5]MBV7409584.1 hypothetical protein [Maritimibacter sp. DP1N21-5]
MNGAAWAMGAGLAVSLLATGASAQDAKQILDLTKSNWVAVRPYDGQDLLYFTNLLAWRCGLDGIRYAVNGEGLSRLETEPCYDDEVAPNAIKADGIQPYLAFPQGSVKRVTVEVRFPDGSTQVMDYARADVMAR